MLIHSEAEMVEYGKKLAQSLQAPQVLELLGDVGAGKTTLTRGIASGLGVQEPVSSPSFTISKEYQGEKYRLVHYDFYRLPDPGLMAEDLDEAISDPHAIVLVEWANSVENILPASTKKIVIKYNDDGTREVTL
jgi:tRNA threonylcarbamoyladenosine biosynthesis protein TsaE